MSAMRPLAALALALAVATPALAADAEEAAIRAQVDRIFAAMKAGDAAALEAVVYPDGVLTVVGPDGVRRVPFRDWMSRVAGRPGVEERIWDAKILRRGDMAVVWAPFDLKIDGKLSHCGFDSIDLVKAQGTWKVAAFMYTHEPNACDELRHPM